VTVPGGVAAKLKVDAGLGAVDVDTGRFPKSGDYYISPDFDRAENRVELDIDCDLGRVKVR
jgi:hypothetical protein